MGLVCNSASKRRNNASQIAGYERVRSMFTGNLKDWKVTDKAITVTLEVKSSKENREILAAMFIGDPLSVNELQGTLTYEEGAE